MHLQDKDFTTWAPIDKYLDLVEAMWSTQAMKERHFDSWITDLRNMHIEQVHIHMVTIIAVFFLFSPFNSHRIINGLVVNICNIGGAANRRIRSGRKESKGRECSCSCCCHCYRGSVSSICRVKRRSRRNSGSRIRAGREGHSILLSTRSNATGPLAFLPILSIAAVRAICAVYAARPPICVCRWYLTTSHAGCGGRTAWDSVAYRRWVHRHWCRGG